MRKILMSLASIGAVAVVAFNVSGAFFSDSEVSNDNTFTAGSIDLQVGAEINESPNADANSVVVQNLDGQILFTYTDLKPGDSGDGRFIVESTSNDYWACIQTTDVTSDENTLVDAETDEGDDATEGELQNYLTFAFWNDVNGNGVYDDGVDSNLVGPWLEGSEAWIPEGLYTMTGLEAAGWIPLADSTPASFFSSTALNPSSQYNLGFKYCFGEMQPDLSCPVGGNQNDAQTDMVSGSLEFFAVQSRNNDQFTCASLNEPEITTESFSGWPTVSGGAQSVLWQAEGRYANNGPTGDWEIGVGTDTQVPATFNQNNFVWPLNNAVPFTVEYDTDSDTATFTVDGVVTSYVVGAPAATKLFLVAVAPTGVSDTTTLDNLVVNGTNLPDVITATGSSAKQSLEILGVDLTQDFTVSGEVTFNWTTTSGSSPAFQLQVTN